MESYGGSGAGRAPGAGSGIPHYSNLSNPQIIETLQKQGGYPAQMDEQGDNQSQNENQEGKWPQSHDGLNIVERKWLWAFP
jgi:hypothetical protein